MSGRGTLRLSTNSDLNRRLGDQANKGGACTSKTERTRVRRGFGARVRGSEGLGRVAWPPPRWSLADGNPRDGGVVGDSSDSWMG